MRVSKNKEHQHFKLMESLVDVISCLAILCFITIG